MTEDPKPSGPAGNPAILDNDLGEVRLGQAQLLFRRTVNSCLIVEGVILYFTAMIAFSGHARFALVWFAMTSSMVLIVFLYSRFFRPGITRENMRRYLRGHVVISGMTGLVWSGLAITYLDPSSTLNLFISVNIVVSIALGGMLPSAEYRPTFISLSTGMFLPFAIYWLVAVDGSLRLIGVGVLILYGFGLLVSARSEIQTVQSLAAERNRQLTEKLQEQYSIIEKASAEKSRFLAATSHDMSQPLQAQGFFIRAMRDRITSPEQADLLDRIEGAWRSQRNLLQALVETARLSSGAIVTRTDSFALAPVLEELRSEFAAGIERKSLTLDMPETDLTVVCDQLLLIRILRNLIGNAVKFTPPGGRIEVTVSEDGYKVWIGIADNGPGIPRDKLDVIFEEYVQLEPASGGDEKGLGLGLPIVHQLTRKMDIPFEFESVHGQGTTARIALEKSDRPATAAQWSSETEFAGAPLIALVEDEPQVRDSLSMLLTQWGCRAIAAASGGEARRLLSWTNETPRALIVDKRLGNNEDGLDVIAQLRDEVLEPVPAVLLTGDIEEFTRAASMESVTILPKPADGRQLHIVLSRILAG